MRIAIFKYIEQNKDAIYNVESQLELGTLLPSAYITDSGFNFKGFYEEYLLSMHNEAEQIIIYLAPIIFDINLDLYILEGTAKLNNKNISYFKQSMPCLYGANSRLTISLMYRFAHFDSLYTYSLINQFGRNIAFKMMPIEERMKNRMKVVCETICEVCKRQSEALSFQHIPELTLCKLCLLDFVNKVMVIRIKSYISESYNNKECKYNL